MDNQSPAPSPTGPAGGEEQPRSRRAKRAALLCGAIMLAGALGLHFFAQRHFLDKRGQLSGFVLEAKGPSAPGAALAPGIHVKDQLALDDVAQARALGYAGIIDMRPDGEARGQPTADQVALEARIAGIPFAYVPVPHGDIPDSAVVAFRMQYERLAGANEPVLIYCRSGRRAARTWALSAAAYGDVPIADIQKAVKDAGQDAEDLGARMAAMRADKAAWSNKLDAGKAVAAAMAAVPSP